MSRFAEKTSVNSSKSREEIERTLARYGATGFMYGWTGEQATVAFAMNDRHIKFVLPMPDRKDFILTPTKRTRSIAQIEAHFEQAIRQKWRALALVIKAKLEAVESGITEFDDEFMAHILLPDGQRVGDFMKPQIRIAYERGDMPPLLPDYSGERQ